MSRGLILEAAYFARAKHEGQTRKMTGAPYIHHPGRVAMRVTLLGASDEEIAAAWLHDVVEDCGVPISEIESRFGPAVAGLVHGLTNVYKAEAYPEMNRRARKDAELRRIFEQPRAVRRIKLVDRIDNLGEIDPFDDFTKVYMMESAALLESLRMASNPDGSTGTDRDLETEMNDALRRLAAVRAQARAGL